MLLLLLLLLLLPLFRSFNSGVAALHHTSTFFNTLQHSNTSSL